MINRQEAGVKSCVEQALSSEHAEDRCVCDLMPAWPGRAVPQPVKASSCGTCRCDAGEQRKVCGFGVEGAVLAAVWSPLNRFEDLYDADAALRRGTLFAALDKPFYGEGKEVDCRGNER